MVRRLQISNLSCTKHRDGTVELGLKSGLQSLQVEFGPRQWNDLAQNVVLFGAFDVDVPRVRARLSELRKVAKGGAVGAVLDELEELLEPPKGEGHWFGCTLPSNHEGDCMVRRSR